MYRPLGRLAATSLLAVMLIAGPVAGTRADIVQGAAWTVSDDGSFGRGRYSHMPQPVTGFVPAGLQGAAPADR